eukprot:UN24540
MEKFKSKFMKKVMEPLGIHTDDLEQFYMPIGKTVEFDEDELPDNGPEGKTYGVIFVELKNKDKADMLRNADNLRMGKNPLKITNWEEWLKAKDHPDKFVPPNYDDFSGTNEARQWLEDARGRDQFVVRFQSGRSQETNVCWGDNLRGGMVLETDFSKYKSTHKNSQGGALSCVTARRANWSPLGTYLTTQHPKGLKILQQGKRCWEIANRISIEGEGDAVVEDFFWSPQEKWLTTYSNGGRLVQMWDANNPGKPKSFDGGFFANINRPYPYFEWSFDDRYFGWLKCSKYKKAQYDQSKLTRNDLDRIVIWDAVARKKLGKAISIDSDNLNVRGLKFSPGRHFFVYFCKGSKNDQHSSISIRDFSEKKKLQATRLLYGVHNVKMQWHKRGDWLSCCIITEKRRRKRKKRISTLPVYTQINNKIWMIK